MDQRRSMEGTGDEARAIVDAAHAIARELLGFELHLGFPLSELASWPDEEVASLFIVRAIVLWRERFPTLEEDPLLGPRRGTAAREALVEALGQRAATLRSMDAERPTELSSPERLARLFE